MRKTIVAYMDVEDPYNPASDDAILDFTQLFSDLGVRATFPISGAKCRRLKRLGREDVFEAMSHHAVGLHTNTHSEHPTTMELLEDKGWMDGIQAAYEAQAPGLESFKAVFHRDPVCYAGAGYTWGSQITAMLPKLGIPACAYSPVEYRGGQVHEYVGVFSMPEGFPIEEPNWLSDETAAQVTQQALAQIEASTSPVVGIFLGHPTRMRHTNFWDVPYYAGINPDEYVGPPPHPEPEYRAAVARFKAFIQLLTTRYDIKGFDAVQAMPWQWHDATASEREHAKKALADNLPRINEWPVHKPNLNIERILSLATQQVETLRVATLSSVEGAN